MRLLAGIGEIRAPGPVWKWRLFAIFFTVLLASFFIIAIMRYQFGWDWTIAGYFTCFAPMFIVSLMERRLAKRLRMNGDRFCWECLYPLRVGDDDERVVCSECGSESTPERDARCRQYLQAPGRFGKRFDKPPPKLVEGGKDIALTRS